MKIRIYDSGDLIQMYLDWFNNFLTVPRFAEYYGITESFASQVIDRGREVYNAQLDGSRHVTVTKGARKCIH